MVQDEGNANVAAEEPKRALGKFDAPDAVFNKELKPADKLVKIEIQFYDSYLYSVEDTACLLEIGEQFASAMVIPYTPKTFNPDATLHFEYADGSITTLATDLGAYVFCLNDIYYNFAFRETAKISVRKQTRCCANGLIRTIGPRLFLKSTGWAH